MEPTMEPVGRLGKWLPFIPLCQDTVWRVGRIWNPGGRIEMTIVIGRERVG